LRAEGNIGLQHASNVYRHYEDDVPRMEVLPQGKNAQESKRGRLITSQKIYGTGGTSTLHPLYPKERSARNPTE
jgi:hypothetical protein